MWYLPKFENENFIKFDLKYAVGLAPEMFLYEWKELFHVVILMHNLSNIFLGTKNVQVLKSKNSMTKSDSLIMGRPLFRLIWITNNASTASLLYSSCTFDIQGTLLCFYGWNKVSISLKHCIFFQHQPEFAEILGLLSDGHLRIVPSPPQWYFLHF